MVILARGPTARAWGWAACLCLVALAIPAQAQQRPTIAAGEWSDPAIWAAGVVPAASDAVSLRHRVTARQDVTAQSVYVRRGGALIVTDAVTLRVPGVLSAEGGSSLVLQGPQLGTLSSLTAVLREDETTMMVEDSSQRWEAGALVGAWVILRGGRARTWRFQVLANTATTLSVRLPYPNVSSEILGVDPVDVDTIDVSDEFIQGRRGQILARHAEVGGRSPSFILGAQDVDGGLDRLVLWPAAPAGARVVTTTYGLAAGDRYTLHRAVRLVAGLVYAADDASVSLRRIALEGGFIQVERTDGFELMDSDLSGADPGCFVLGREVSNTRIVGNHIHDVSPDSDLVEFGGRWTADQQRGHGICLYGQGHLVQDNLLTNLNDDMIYVGPSSDVVIRGNVALATGVYHGNSFECITARQADGLVVEGNIAGGGQLALLLDDRGAGTTTIRSNLLLQDAPRAAVLADRSGPGAGVATLSNNVIVGSATGPVTAQARHAPAVYQGNYFQGVTLVDAAEVRGNLFRGSGRSPQPLLKDPSWVVSNLFVAPWLPAQNALVLVGAGSVDVVVDGNSFNPGAGAAIRHDPPASAVSVYRDNLSLGPLFGEGSRADPEALIEGNAVAGPASLAQGGSRLHPSADTNDVLEVRWADRGYLVAECAPRAFGFDHAGVAAPAEVPLRPAGAFRQRRGESCQTTGERTPWSPSLPAPDDPVQRAKPGSQCTSTGPPDLVWRWWTRR